MSHLRTLLRAREVRLTRDGALIGCADIAEGTVGVIEVVEAFAGRVRVRFANQTVTCPVEYLQPLDAPRPGRRAMRTATA